MRLPCSRRRLLAGVAGAVGLSGCNGDADADRRETVTPVEVPESRRDRLSAVTEPDPPAVPPPDFVDEAHADLAADHLLTVVDEAAAAVEALDRDPETVGIADPGPRFSEARRTAASLREEPPLANLRRCRATIAKIARTAGRAGDAAGVVDPERIAEETDAVNEAAEEFLEDTEYRFYGEDGGPFVAVARGERRLFERRRERPRSKAASVEIPARRRYLAELRGAYRDAVEFSASATDPNVPSRFDALEGLFERLLSATRPPVMSHREAKRRLSTIGNSSTDEIRRSLILKATDGEQIRDDARTSWRQGGRCHAVLAIARWLTEYRAISTAAETALPGAEGVTPDRLLGAKRTAIDRLETVASVGPLPRTLGRDGREAIERGDALLADADSRDVDALYALFAYVEGGALAREALIRAWEIRNRNWLFEG